MLVVLLLEGLSTEGVVRDGAVDDILILISEYFEFEDVQFFFDIGLHGLEVLDDFRVGLDDDDLGERGFDGDLGVVSDLPASFNHALHLSHHALDSLVQQVLLVLRDLQEVQ